MKRLLSAAPALFLGLAGAHAATTFVDPLQTYSCASHTWANSLAASTGVTTCTQPAVSDLSGNLESLSAGLGNSAGTFNTGSQALAPGGTLYPQTTTVLKTANYTLNADYGGTTDTARTILANGSASIQFTLPTAGGTLGTYQLGDYSGHGYTAVDVGGTFYGCTGASPATSLTVSAFFTAQFWDLGTGNGYWCLLQPESGVVATGGITAGSTAITGGTAEGTAYEDSGGHFNVASPGTSGYVWTSNGSSSAPSFQAASTPDLSVISTQTATSGTTTALTFTSLPADRKLTLSCSGLLTGGGSDYLKFYVGEGAGPTWETAATYTVNLTRDTNGTTTNLYSATGPELTDEGLGYSSTLPTTIELTIYNVASSSIFKMVQLTAEADVAGSVDSYVGTSFWNADTNPITGLEVTVNAGTFGGVCTLSGGP